MNPGPGKTAVEVKSAVHITIYTKEDYIMTEEQEVKILKETPTTPMDDADTTAEKK